MNRDEQVIAIAANFDILLLEDIGVSRMAEVKRLNATPDFASPVCASHNFCDANMVMCDAFAAVVGREPIMDEDEDPAQSDADCALWNDAWDAWRRGL